LATAFSDTSGTVLPNTTWKAARSSIGLAGRPQARAVSSDEVSANRVGYSAVYSARSPAVTVRGVAWVRVWPTA
jgi:hypothetical protein